MKLLPLAILLAACTPGAQPDAVDVTAYTAEQMQCVEQADARPAADACRAASHDALCRRFPSLSTCQDGGQ
jgi:hypothetical protein